VTALFRRPVVSWVHELDYASRAATRQQELRTTLLLSDRFIACSHAVSTFLQGSHAIDAGRINVVHEFVQAETVASRSSRAGAELRRSLRIPDKARVVGAAGTVELRKGVDLFMDVARRVLAAPRSVDARFLWVGGSGTTLDLFRADIAKAGLSSKIFFVGERRDAPDCFNAFDVFALPSREDPYPLVMLESAALAKPTVCFLGNGGAPEFVEDDAGICVPPGGVEAFASAVEALLVDDARRRRYGARARQKALERHDVTVAAPQVLKVIQSAANELGCRGGLGRS
jgi:glycosyltransferase involved in cell wall biosynthesis